MIQIGKKYKDVECFHCGKICKEYAGTYEEEGFLCADCAFTLILEEMDSEDEATDGACPKCGSYEASLVCYSMPAQYRCSKCGCDYKGSQKIGKEYIDLECVSCNKMCRENGGTYEKDGFVCASCISEWCLEDSIENSLKEKEELNKAFEAVESHELSNITYMVAGIEDAEREFDGFKVITIKNEMQLKMDGICPICCSKDVVMTGYSIPAQYFCNNCRRPYESSYGIQLLNLPEAIKRRPALYKKYLCSECGKYKLPQDILKNARSKDIKQLVCKCAPHDYIFSDKQKESIKSIIDKGMNREHVIEYARDEEYWHEKYELFKDINDQDFDKGITEMVRDGDLTEPSKENERYWQLVVTEWMPNTADDIKIEDVAVKLDPEKYVKEERAREDKERKMKIIRETERLRVQGLDDKRSEYKKKLKEEQ
jgi:hypothetical protein